MQGVIMMLTDGG